MFTQLTMLKIVYNVRSRLKSFSVLKEKKNTTEGYIKLQAKTKKMII